MTGRCPRRIAAAFLFAAACLAQAPRRGTPGAHVQIELELTQQRFLVKESIPLTMRIRNDGSVPLDLPDPEINVNWQPVYTVTGPQFPQGHSFSFRSVALGDARLAPAGAEAETIHLNPGQTHVARPPVGELMHLEKPGAYTLSAKLDWNGVSAQSRPVTFEIGPPSFRSFQVSAIDGAQPSYPIRVYGLAGEPSHADIYMAAFNETRPDLGEISIAGISRLSAAGPGTEAILSAWVNYAGIGTPAPGVVWQAGATLGKRDGGKITLPSAPRLVRPALGLANGELYVFGIAGDGNELQMAHFPAGTGAPTVAWRQALSGRAFGARAAIGPASGGSGRFVILVTGGADSAALTLVSPDGRPARSVAAPHAAPVAGSEPGIFVDAAGVVHTSVLMRVPGEPRRAVLIDATWPAGGEPVVKRGSEIPLAADIRSAQAGYSVAEGGRRRDWAALLSDGRLISSKSDQPRVPKTAPVTPLEMLPMSVQTYLLTIVDGLPRFEVLF